MSTSKPVHFVVSKTGLISHLTFHRPLATPRQFTLHLPLPHDGASRATIERSIHQRATVFVVAYEPRDKCGYKYGLYNVTAKSKTTFTLEKHMSAVVKEARELALKQVHDRVQQRVTQLRGNTQNAKHAAAGRTQPLPVVFAPPASDQEVQAAAEPEQKQHEQPEAPRALVTTVYARPAETPTVQPPITTFFARHNMPKAIPTTYNGVHYRSRLESKFARMLDALHITFVYEPMRVRTGDKSTYTIDFFLPDQQLYVELKPKRPHVEEERKCENMSKMGFRVVLMYGDKLYKLPFRSEFYNGRSHRDYDHHDALRGMCWIQGNKLPGDTVFVVGTQPTLTTPLDVPCATQVHLNQVQSSYDMRWNHDVIRDALRTLKFI